MTSREIVRRNITFDNPPRIAIKFDVFGFNDCYDIWLKDNIGHEQLGGGADEWGCMWSQTEMRNTGQVTYHPLADWGNFEAYRFPDAEAPQKYTDFEHDLAGAGDKFVMYCGGLGLFERFHTLRGFENALVDLYAEPEKTNELLDRILDFHMKAIAKMHKLGNGRIDAVAISDDWGTEVSSIISPDKFREFFKPRYIKLFKQVHDLGMHTWMHSCGKINDVLDDLIDAGLEVVNSQQPMTVGIDEFAERFAGRVCFETIVDTQITYPFGTFDEIRAQARELVAKWNTPRGGFIASDYSDAEAIGTTIERRRVAFDTFAEIAGISIDG
jgi:hypothetical protein